MRRSTVISCLLVPFFLCGCTEKKSEPYHRDVFAMDTYMGLTAYGENAPAALEMAEKEINRLESLMSVTKSDSDIGRINSSAGDPVEVSDDTAELISKAIEFGKFTDGALDITIYPVLREWGFTSDDHDYHIPGMGILDDLLSNVDFKQIDLDGNMVTIPADYKIDLGALAKGYASDRVMDVLQENGVDTAIISLGGNVKTMGKKSNGEPWHVAIRSPFDDTPLGYVDVDEKAVVTSGGYERNFTGEDGKIYHHIIDPSDGYPAENGLASVTIISPDGTLCDGMSTAIFVAGTDKSADIWRNRNDFEMILVTDKKEIMVTEGIEPNFRCSSSMKKVVITRD